MYNPFSLANKTILVTGASSGIGRSVAIACSKMGAHLVISGRNKNRLNETFLQLEGDGHVQVIADLSKQVEIEKLVDEVPYINGYVHSAGIPKICAVKFIERQTIEDIININTVAPILLVSLLVKKKKMQKQSSIVLIASISGVYTANTGEAPYAATKSALAGFAKTAALELASQQTRVNIVCPGIIKTKLLNLSNSMFSEEQLEEKMLSRYPLKRFGSPDDVANGVIYLLSDASKWVTGANLVIDGGFTLA